MGPGPWMFLCGDGRAPPTRPATQEKLCCICCACRVVPVSVCFKVQNQFCCLAGAAALPCDDEVAASNKNLGRRNKLGRLWGPEGPGTEPFWALWSSTGPFWARRALAFAAKPQTRFCAASGLRLEAHVFCPGGARARFSGGNTGTPGKEGKRNSWAINRKR